MANVKITQLPELAETPASGDLFEIVDISTGLNKKVQAQYIAGGAVDSVNGQTGVVSIDLQSVSDENNVVEYGAETTFAKYQTGADVFAQVVSDDDGFVLLEISQASDNKTFYEHSAINYIVNGNFIGMGFPNINGTIGLLDEIQTTNFTAVNYKGYNANGTLTVTDPTPLANAGYQVHVIGGSVTIGGVAYTSGALVYRYYDGSSWISTNMNTAIDSTPTDGSSNAVSSNGVFDALALKADKNRVEQILRSKNNGTYGSHTGNTTNTAILTIPITGGEFVIGDWMNLMFDFTKVGTAGTAVVRFYAGTLGTTSDPLIGTLLLTATVLDAGWSRERLQFKTGNLLSGINSGFSSSVLDVVVSTLAKQSTSLDPSADWILTVAIQLSSSADTVSCEGYTISKISSF